MTAVDDDVFIHLKLNVLLCIISNQRKILFNRLIGLIGIFSLSLLYCLLMKPRWTRHNKEAAYSPIWFISCTQIRKNKYRLATFAEFSKAK